jgi:hypothetical protein
MGKSMEKENSFGQITQLILENFMTITFRE